MCFYTQISLIPPSKHFSCPSIFWGMWTCLELYPGVLFLSAPCSVHGSAAWQHSTMKDLMHRASGKFRDKQLYLELHAERGWKQVQALKGCSRADLGNPGGRSQGHRQQSSHVRGLVFTLYCTGLTVFVGKSIIFWYWWYFCVCPVLRTWTDKGGTAIRKRPVGMCHWAVPWLACAIGWFGWIIGSWLIISVPFVRYQTGEPCWHMALQSLDTDSEERASSAESTKPRPAGNPTSTVVFVACLLRRVLHGS